MKLLTLLIFIETSTTLADEADGISGLIKWRQNQDRLRREPVAEGPNRANQMPSLRGVLPHLRPTYGPSLMIGPSMNGPSTIAHTNPGLPGLRQGISDFPGPRPPSPFLNRQPTAERSRSEADGINGLLRTMDQDVGERSGRPKPPAQYRPPAPKASGPFHFESSPLPGLSGPFTYTVASSRATILNWWYEKSNQ